jgi:hypothetical protein
LPGSYTITAQIKLSNGVTSDITEVCTKTVVVVDNSPLFTCDALDASKVINRTTREVAVSYTVKNATVTGFRYVYGSVNEVVSASVRNITFPSAAGSYKVKVSVITDKGESAANTACEATVVIAEEPVTPVHTCDAMTVILVNKQIKVSVVVTATGGASVKSYTYVIKNASGAVVYTLVSDKPMFDYSFATDGTYTVTASITFTVNGADVTVEPYVNGVAGNCVKTVVVSPEVCPIDSSMRKDDPRCVPCATNAGLLAGDARCVKTPEQPRPPVLPNTGLGDLVAAFAAISIAAGLGHRVVTARKF